MDRRRERACTPVPLPPPMATALQGYRWARDTVGESGGEVCRLHGKPAAPDLFLKSGRGTVADDVTDEMVRPHWPAHHVPVPAVVGFANCLGEFDTALQQRLFAQCGIAAPDRRKLDFHLMLDGLC